MHHILPAIGLTQEAFARRLGVSRRAISELLHERRPIAVDMTIRLGTLLGNGPDLWLYGTPWRITKRNIGV